MSTGAAMPPTRATATDLEADIGIPHCLFSGNKEKAGCRVIPDLATLILKAPQPNTLGR